MAAPSHKLSTSLEGALAGGGDPATSPLYVFGPFLRLIVVAGVASVTFGTTVWMVVFTIAVVSLMYRLVMRWITDGSGGSGLSEEEFGPWAGKINAAITFIEYTLTFLVSMAAMVTFIADRFPALNLDLLGIQYRTFLAIALSIGIGWLVNRGPKVAARAFGPATAGVLLLLWTMVVAALLRFGLRLPPINLQAFQGPYLKYTFAGYARILAVMTGIEVFANLVAAYEGPPEKRSRQAFGSLLIIMTTAAATMLIVGPAILALSDPLKEGVSVFTQAMDALLPPTLAYAGTLVGALVLMSASAASAQGLQNLALGLWDRNYIPAGLGQRNRFDVAHRPVWIQVGIVTAAFLILGTHEETYLALYAAGVFILLSLTGWAASKRLLRTAANSLRDSATLLGTLTAAALTTAATVLIFEERFFEGAWAYLVFIPALYLLFTYFRNTLGPPSPVLDQVGEIEGALLGGFGYGQALKAAQTPLSVAVAPADERAPMPFAPRREFPWQGHRATFEHLLVPLDGSVHAEMALPMAEAIAGRLSAKITLITRYREQADYVRQWAEALSDKEIDAGYVVGEGSVVEVAREMVEHGDADLVVASTRGGSGSSHWLSGGVASRIAQEISKPVLLVQAENGKTPQVALERLLVTLDGSEQAERLMDYALGLGHAFQAELLLLTVPEAPDPGAFGVGLASLEEARKQSEQRAWAYLAGVREAAGDEVPSVRTLVTGSRPGTTIVQVGRSTAADMILMTSRVRRGLGGLWMGNVALRVVEGTDLPVFFLPIHNGLAEVGERRRSGQPPAAASRRSP